MADFTTAGTRLVDHGSTRYAQGHGQRRKIFLYESIIARVVTVPGRTETVDSATPC